MKKIFYVSLLIGFFTCQLFAKIGVVVNKDLYPFVQQKITQYVFDLNQIEKKSVWLDSTNFNAENTIFELRDSLRRHYENDSLEGVVFVGDLPIALYEVENDYDKDGYRNFPIDLFYMDLDGEWLDTAKAGAWNGKAQTGVFDAHTGNRLAEIWMSRITAGVTRGLGNEQEIVNAYFEKVHKYMTGNFNAPNKYLILVNDKEWSDAVSWANGFRLGYSADSMDIYLRSNGEDTKANWGSGLVRGYESAFIAEHSSYVYHSLANNITYANYDYLEGETTNTRFYNLFACSNSRYTETNFLGGLYAWGHNGLISVGSTKTGAMLDFYEYYMPMSNDSSFGESFKYWLNIRVLNSREIGKIYWHYGMTLCGAGTLHLKPKVQPLQLKITPEIVEDSVRISFVINDLSLEGHLIPIELCREDNSLVNYYRHTVTIGENTVDLSFGSYPQGTYKIKVRVSSSIVDSVSFRIISNDGILIPEPKEINFGKVEIGKSGRRVLSLANNGNRDITISNVSFSEMAFSPDFTLPLTIPAKNQKTIYVLYSPTYKVENQTGTMTIESNANQTQPLTVSLTGSGVYETHLSVDPATFRTNAVVSYDTKDNSYFGRIADFKLYQIFRGGIPRVFVQQFTGSIKSGVNTIAKSDWDYLPSGYYMLEMSVDNELIASYAFEKLNSVNVTDFAVSPSPVVDNAIVSFTANSPSVLVGKTAYLVCRQDGRDIFSQLITVGEGVNSYTIPFNSYNSLPSGNYTMVLMASSIDVASANFTKVNKSAAITVSSSALNFGSVTVGTQKVLSLTLTNTGNSNAVIGAMNLSKPEFSHNGTLPITIAPQQSVTVNVTFAPSVSGNFSDVLMIVNAPDANVQTLKVSLSGIGAKSQSAAIKIKLIPDSDINGNFIQSQISLTNSGSSPLDLSNLVLEYYTYDPSVNVNNLRCDIYYCSVGNPSSTSFRKLPSVVGNSSHKADLVAEISLRNTLGANRTMSLQYGIHTTDWQYKFNETDDWSHVTGNGNSSSNIVIRNKVTGEILFGNEPK